MADRALSMARDHAPWQAGTAWWVTGIEGIALALIGLYFLLAPAAAGGLLVQLIALVLLIQSVLQMAASFRAAGASDPYVMLQAGIGATVGLLIVLRGWLVPTLDGRSALTILGLGLLAYALVGLADSLLHRDEGESWYGPIVTDLLLIVLALVLLTSSDANALDRLALLGWVALIGGAVLLFLAWRAREREAA